MKSIGRLSIVAAVIALAVPFVSVSAANAAPLASSGAGTNASADPDEGAPDSPPPTEGALDPATFEGTILVAVPSGNEVKVTVKAGEAPAVINAIQSADAAGQAQTRGEVVSPMATCGELITSFGGPFGYVDSVNGCAVAGYPGYEREYKWTNGSDVGLCTKGKGFSRTTGAATWYGTGCSSGAYLIPWGNVLAYTQMQGYSTSGVTGAAYRWRA